MQPGQSFHSLIVDGTIGGALPATTSVPYPHLTNRRLAAEPFAFWQMVSRGEAIKSFEFYACKASGECTRLAVSVVVVLGPDPLLDPTAELASSAPPDLTHRQLEVLRLMAQGTTVGRIADSLGVSIHTVRSHIQRILEKLDAHSQAEAVARAFRERLL